MAKFDAQCIAYRWNIKIHLKFKLINFSCYSAQLSHRSKMGERKKAPSQRKMYVCVCDAADHGTNKKVGTDANNKVYTAHITLSMVSSSENWMHNARDHWPLIYYRSLSLIFFCSPFVDVNDRMGQQAATRPDGVKIHQTPVRTPAKI